MRKFVLYTLKFFGISLVSFLFWILFVVLQQYNHRIDGQIYLMGTLIGYALVFIFLFVVIYFLFAFYNLRSNPDRLKQRFFIFAGFYIISSPLVVLSFDNYLSVTPHGMVYNTFFSLGDEEIRTWQDIGHVELDYTTTALPLQRQTKPRLVYRVVYKNGSSVNLNHYNSPLYAATQFKAIHKVMIKQDIPIQKKRAIPPDYKEKYPFIYDMYMLSEM
ncbi:hypothetical protein IC620_12420 [Hazenella sp. IB182357]|uniref:Uncharacterized protein n=1 Tax=Polycladospora coralii TaxID=2771432 RepID=A0A926ND27_9BACL|nr:hypothetical protein [Polycladospora coralii]MBD1373160.1 hypothetical protein [Polycladospora coralii]MBS7531717.1 hypothetical protein [Polycladospora coralii]